MNQLWIRIPSESERGGETESAWNVVVDKIITSLQKSHFGEHFTLS